MTNITNHFEAGSCIFEAGSTMNGDVNITGGTFYQGKPQDKKQESKDKTPQSTSKTSSSSKPSPSKLKPLFVHDADNAWEENAVVRRRERDRFMKYLSLHKMGNRELTTTKDDTLNSIVACFLIVWRDNGWIAKDFSGNAVHRFLHEECGIRSGISEQSYANKIVKWVKDKSYSIDVLAEVETFMKKNS